jgi:hypothetical protein
MLVLEIDFVYFMLIEGLSGWTVYLEITKWNGERHKNILYIQTWILICDFAF